MFKKFIAKSIPSNRWTFHWCTLVFHPHPIWRQWVVQSSPSLRSRWSRLRSLCWLFVAALSWTRFREAEILNKAIRLRRRLIDWCLWASFQTQMQFHLKNVKSFYSGQLKLMKSKLRSKFQGNLPIVWICLPRIGEPAMRSCEPDLCLSRGMADCWFPILFDVLNYFWKFLQFLLFFELFSYFRNFSEKSEPSKISFAQISQISNKSGKTAKAEATELSYRTNPSQCQCHSSLVRNSIGDQRKVVDLMT